MIIYAGKLQPSGVSEEVSFRDGGITPIAPFVAVVSAPRDPNRDGINFMLWHGGDRLPLNVESLVFSRGMALPMYANTLQAVAVNIENTNEVGDAQAYNDLAEPIENANEVEEPLAGFYQYATVDSIENTNEVSNSTYYPIQLYDASPFSARRLDPDTLTYLGDEISLTLSGNEIFIKTIAGSRDRLFIGFSERIDDEDDDSEGYAEIDPNDLSTISKVWTNDHSNIVSTHQITVTSDGRLFSFISAGSHIREVDPDSSFAQIGSNWDPSGTHGGITSIYAYGEMLFVIGSTSIGVYQTTGSTIGSFTLLDTITLPTWLSSASEYSLSVSGFRGFAFKFSGGNEITEFNPLTVDQIGSWTAVAGERGVGGQNLSQITALPLSSTIDDVENDNEVGEPSVELFGATAQNPENTNEVQEPTLINLLNVENDNEVADTPVYGKLSVDIESTNEVETLIFVNVLDVENENEVGTSSLGYYINNIQNENEVEDVVAGLVVLTDSFELNLNIENFNFINEPIVRVVPEISSVDSVENTNEVLSMIAVVSTFNYGKIRFTRKSPSINKSLIYK